MKKMSKVKKILIIIVILLLTVMAIVFPIILRSEAYFNWQLNQHGKYLSINFLSDSVIHNNSRLYNYEGLTILDMSGTEAEMGYSHGYLLGNYIKYSVEYTLTIIGNLSGYNEMHDNILPYYLLRNSTYYSEEIGAIYEGAMDSGADLYVEVLGRNWDVMDLWMLNTIQDWYQVACSGVGVWGNSSNTGKTIIGRDLDFYYDRHGYITQLYTIMIFRGNESRYDIVSFSLPGIIGIISGFNSEGVWMHMNSSNGDMTKEHNRTGISLAIRRFLEREDGTEIASRSQNYFLEQNIAHSVLLMVGSKSADSPVFVLEVRDSVVGYRGEVNSSDDYVILTNHEMVNKEPQYCYRYSRYLSDINEYLTTGDQLIDNNELLLSQQHCGQNGTINAIQFCPIDLTFRIGYSRIVNVPFGKKWSDDDLVQGPYDPLLEKWFSLNELLGN